MSGKQFAALKPIRDPSGRPPVKDEKTEMAVLCCILDAERQDHATAFDRVAEILMPEHFFDARNQHIFRAAQELYVSGAAVSFASVIFWLADRELTSRAGGDEHMRAIASSWVTSIHLEQDAVHLRDLARQRLMVEKCHRVVAEGYDRHPDVQEWMDGHVKDLEDIASAPEQRTIITMGEGLRETFGKIEAAAERGDRMVGIPTGFRELDAITAGWQDTELTILAGRPGMGKSACGMKCAINIAKGAPTRDGLLNGVAFFSVEMPREPLLMRTIATMSRVNLHLIKAGKLQPMHWDAMTKAASWMSALPVWVDDYSGLNTMDLRAKCRKIMAKAERSGKARLSAIVVDYLQRMKPIQSSRPRSRQEEVGQISWALKNLAKEFGVPVIALAQINRDVEKEKDKRPKLSDLRESGDIEQDADNVIFIHREEYYLKEKTPSELQGVAELIVEKQRNGPPDTALTRFYKEYALFEDGPTY